MTITSHRLGRAAAGAALVLGGLTIASCGTQGSSAAAPAASRPVAATSTTGTATATAATTTTTLPTTTTTAAVPAPSGVTARPIAHYVAAAKHVFDTETSGPPTLRLFHQVVDDPQLLALLHSGNDKAAMQYAATMFRDKWAPEHMARLRFISGGRTRMDLGVPWVVWPMPQRTVTRAGHPPMTIQVAEQDVIGFVRSMHSKHRAVEVVARDASGQHAVSLLGVAARAQLPKTGFVTLRGVRYEVRSFHRSSFAQSILPTTVWVLLPTN